MRRTARLTLMILALALFAVSAWAEDAAKPAAEPVKEAPAPVAAPVPAIPAPPAVSKGDLDLLKLEIDKLKAELAATKAKLSETPEAKPEAKKEVGDVITSLGNKLKFYGFIRLDITYDSARTKYSNWALWVTPNKSFTRTNGEQVIPHSDGVLAITPRLSRIGIELTGVDIDLLKAKLGGMIELDFFGGGTMKERDDWASMLRWRKAYLSLSWDWLEIRAGQDWDIMSSLVPRYDSSAGWMIGNVGARRPQLSLNFKPKVADNSRLFVQASIGRAGDADSQDIDMKDANKDGVIDLATEVGDGELDGLDSAVPMVQWRLAFEGALWNKKPLIVGASGHYEQYQVRRELWDKAASRFKKQEYHMNSYSVNAELSVPILEWWSLRGEFFWGNNMADTFGGINQGINRESLNNLDKAPQAVKAMGGWIETAIRPVDLWELTLGYSCDVPDEDTLPKDNYKLVEATRYRNQGYYVLNQFFFKGGFSFGVQFFHLMTDYKYVVDTAAKPIKSKTYSAMDERALFFAMYKF